MSISIGELRVPAPTNCAVGTTAESCWRMAWFDTVGWTMSSRDELATGSAGAWSAREVSNRMSAACKRGTQD